MASEPSVGPEARTTAPLHRSLPYAFARAYGVLLADGHAVLHRATAPLAALIEVQRIAGILPWRTLDDTAFDHAFQAHYREAATDAADVAAEAGVDLAALADSASEIDDLLAAADDSPVVRLINALLLEAVKDRASDIHVETQERRLIVRFRIDGVLRDMIEPRRALAPLLVSRIKVMARLDIAEKRVPQDGRVTVRVGGHDIDVRVSTIPTQHGERVVMRLLDRGSVQLDLATLGMNPDQLGLFKGLLARPHGMLLVTGPTGSGKTTSLYAALATLNDRRRNILTVEDPIEYELAGIGQTQVNARTDMSFARGLRAILRQDPDVIMVGEIRDQETAQVAVRAAMTGHFMLSTLHTNSAVGSITRLVDMGVERYLLAPMLVGLVAQRLVRRLCPRCRRADAADARDVARLDGRIAIGTPVWRAAGCAECRNEGYRGRMGLYEIVPIDAGLAALIHDGAAESALVAHARGLAPSLLDDGLAKIAAGETTIEEVARVTQDDPGEIAPPAAATRPA